MSKVLILRTSNNQRQSHNNFVWPESGYVEAPDWMPTTECGNGLHGALWGEGAGILFNWEEDAVWQVVEVEESEIIDLPGQVKFPKGNVIYSGNRKDATDMIMKARRGAVIGAFVIEGDGGTATVGDGGTAIAGYRGIAIAGNEGTATAGMYGTATAGNDGTATSGNDGTATTGDRGTATAGDRGTAIAGYRGIAIAGYRGIAIAGYRGKVSAGQSSIIQIKFYDGNRYRFLTGYIGEDGLEPNVLYKIDDSNKFVKA